MNSNNNSNKKPFKTALCNIWLFKGVCERNNNNQCSFAHGIEELNEALRSQLVEEFPMQPAANNKFVRRIQPCIYYAKGNCQHGDECHFLHSDPQMQKQFFVPIASGSENFGGSSTTLSRISAGSKDKGSMDEDETKKLIKRLVKEQIAKMGKNSKQQNKIEPSSYDSDSS